jgi:hypothetical protein
MRIGLLPPMEVGCGPSNASLGPDEPQPRVVSLRPALPSLPEWIEPAIYGGGHVDLDHQ